VFRIGGEEFAVAWVDLAPGDMRSISFDRVDTEGLAPGEYTTSMGPSDIEQVTGSLTVEPKGSFFAVTGLTPGDETIPEGDQIAPAATVRNTGDEPGTQEIVLKADDATGGDGYELLATRDLALGAGAESAVDFGAVDPVPQSYRYRIASEDDGAGADLLVSDLGVRLREHEAELTPVEFEAIELTESGGPDVLDTVGDPLRRVKADTFSSDPRIPPLYGYVLASEEAIGRIERDSLAEYTLLSEEDGTPRAFVDGTDPDTESLLLLEYHDTSGPAVIDVGVVGTHPDGGLYVAVERKTGMADTPYKGVTLVRIDDPDPPDDLLVGDLYGPLVGRASKPYATDGSRLYPALYASRDDPG